MKVLLLALLLTACGKADDSRTTSNETLSLEGTWKTSCYNSSTTTATSSYSMKMTNTTTESTLTTVKFSDALCTKTASTTVVKRTYKLSKDAIDYTNADGTTTHYTAALGTPYYTENQITFTKE